MSRSPAIKFVNEKSHVFVDLMTIPRSRMLRAYLVIKDITLTELASRMGISPSTVSKWLNNNQVPRYTHNLAEALEVPDWCIIDE